ncbi:PfkB family carbohydrate kinase, partial [Bacillus sp. MHSD17]|nr:PfkB family carbohydrate kinase [Bacillus sp. MHSD17]
TASEEMYQFEEIAKEIDIVHFCGITLAMNDTVRHHMKSLARAVKENGGTVVFDCNYRPSLWGEDGYEQAKPHYEEMLGLADIVMMNEKDAMFVLGIKTEETEREAQLVDLIPKVAETYHIATIAGTHRSINSDNTHSLRGFICKDGTFTFAKTLTFSVYDRIGAGDAYTSGI